MTCGATSGGEVQIDLKAVFFKNLSIFGTTMGSKGDLLQIVNLVAEGKLSPVIDIDTVYSLNELPKAMERLEERSVFGKILCRVG